MSLPTNCILLANTWPSFAKQLDIVDAFTDFRVCTVLAIVFFILMLRQSPLWLSNISTTLNAIDRRNYHLVHWLINHRKNLKRLLSLYTGHTSSGPSFHFFHYSSTLSASPCSLPSHAMLCLCIKRCTNQNHN